MEINEEKSNQWQALKGMGFKAHWDYFWDYYKVHVIAVVFVLVFGIMLIHDVTSNKPYALNGIFINANTLNSPDSIETDFAELEGINTEESEVFLDVSTTLSAINTSQNDVSSTEKIYAMIAAKELDVCLADPQIFDRLASNDVYVDLREYFTEDELSELGDKVYYIDYAEIEAKNNADIDLSEEAMQAEMEAAQNYTFERRDPAEMEKPVPVGIIVENNSLLSDNEFYPGVTPLAGIVISTERGDVAADFIRYLLAH